MEQNKEQQSISYKGYTAAIRWSKEDGCYYGKIENASDLISFEGDTEEKAEIAFREAVDDYIVLAIMENNQHTPTIEEVLAEFAENAVLMERDDFVKAFAKEWASIETEHLRQENKRLNDLYESAMTELRSVLKSRSEMEQENKTLWEKSDELVNHFVTRTKLELEQHNKIYLQADAAKGVEVTWCEDRIDETDVCYVRIDAYEQLQQENERLKAMHSAELKQEAESFEQLFSQWIAFSLPTFKKATPLISLKKLSDEIEEVAHELQHGHENLSVEYVDCIMCLLDSAARAKISVEDLKAAFIYKLEKNKARSWTKNADGTYSHIKP